MHDWSVLTSRYALISKRRISSSSSIVSVDLQGIHQLALWAWCDSAKEPANPSHPSEFSKENICVYQLYQLYLCLCQEFDDFDIWTSVKYMTSDIVRYRPNSSEIGCPKSLWRSLWRYLNCDAWLKGIDLAGPYLEPWWAMGCHIMSHGMSHVTGSSSWLSRVTDGRLSQIETLQFLLDLGRRRHRRHRKHGYHGHHGA